MGVEVSNVRLDIAARTCSETWRVANHDDWAEARPFVPDMDAVRAPVCEVETGGCAGSPSKVLSRSRDYALLQNHRNKFSKLTDSIPRQHGTAAAWPRPADVSTGAKGGHRPGPQVSLLRPSNLQQHDAVSEP